MILNEKDLLSVKGLIIQSFVKDVDYPIPMPRRLIYGGFNIADIAAAFNEIQFIYSEWKEFDEEVYFKIIPIYAAETGHPDQPFTNFVIQELELLLWAQFVEKGGQSDR